MGSAKPMDMTMFLCFILACYGVTNIVTSGKIFQWLRDLVSPISGLSYYINCPMCVGVLVGMCWFLAGVKPYIDAPFFVSMAACGMISSGSCWIIRVVLGYLGEDKL